MRTFGAELIRIRSRRTCWFSVAVLVALHLLVSAENLGQTRDAVARITPYGIIEIFAGEPEPARPALVEWLVASSLQMSIFLPVIAAVAARPEITATLLATPRRIRLVVAQTAAAGAVLLMVALVIAAISGLFEVVEVWDWDPGLPFGADALRGQLTYLGFAVLSALPVFAVTLIARSALAGILFSVLLTAGTMLQFPGWADALLPLSAGRNLLLDPAFSQLSSGPLTAWAVLFGWALTSVFAAALVLTRRDAR
jgi:ABC-2 type transport system permease protein